MLILTIRTDKPVAEIGLYNDATQRAYMTWQANRQLAETVHQRLKELLEDQSQTFKDLGGIVVFKGPGSFTGLRIGISVANALADGLDIPIVSAGDDDWIDRGLQLLAAGNSEQIVVPDYGMPPHITQQKK